MMTRVDLSEASLFLDLDGTLADFQADPSLVGPLERRTRVLRRLLRALDGRVAVISGRTLDEIDRILEAVCPHAAGVHGLQLRTPDGVQATAAPAALAEAREEAAAFAAARTGVRLEDKGLSFALHTRGADAEEGATRAFAEALARRHGMALQHGACVAEVRPAGATKGDALRTFMALAPFAGRMPLFVGDDLTDEHAFEAAASLGGLGVLVGPARPTAASWRLASPAHVLDWLDASAARGAFQSEDLSWRD